MYVYDVYEFMSDRPQTVHDGYLRLPWAAKGGWGEVAKAAMSKSDQLIPDALRPGPARVRIAEVQTVPIEDGLEASHRR